MSIESSSRIMQIQGKQGREHLTQDCKREDTSGQGQVGPHLVLKGTSKSLSWACTELSQSGTVQEVPSRRRTLGRWSFKLRSGV